MFSWAARGAFLGGMLDLVDSSKLAVENEESPKTIAGHAEPSSGCGGWWAETTKVGPRSGGVRQKQCFFAAVFGGRDREALP